MARSPRIKSSAARRASDRIPPERSEALSKRSASKGWHPVPNHHAEELRKAHKDLGRHRPATRLFIKATRRIAQLADEIAQRLFDLPGVSPVRPLDFSPDFNFVLDPRPKEDPEPAEGAQS